MPSPQTDPHERLIAALAAAQRAGNPLPGGDPARWRRITRIAIHRWHIFPRRHPGPAADTPATRTEDLARGLLDRLARAADSPQPPSIADYRALAAHLAPALRSTPPPPPGPVTGLLPRRPGQ